MKRLLSFVWLALALSFVGVQPANAATLLWSWDMESGTTLQNFGTPHGIYNSTGRVGLSALKAHSGAKSLFYSYDGSYNGVLDGTDGTFAPGIFMGGGISEFYAEWWWWTPSTLNPGPPGDGLHGMRFKADYGSQAEEGMVDTVFNTGGRNMFNIDLFGDGVDDDDNHHSLVQLPEDQWFKIGVHLKMNTTNTFNGVMQIWINDALVVNKSNVKYSNTPYLWNDWHLVTNWDHPHPGDYWYFDDFKLYDGVPSGGGGADTDPPIISSPTVGSITSAGGIPAFQSNEGNGIRYYVVVLDGETAPNATQIKLGQRSTGGAATAARNEPVISSGSQTFAVLSTLNANTAYDVYYVQADAAGNDSNVIKADLQTLAVSATNECPANWAALHPTWIWCDDFETDKLASYFEGDASFARVAGAGLNGTVSRRASFTTGVEGAGGLKLAFGLTPPGAGFTQPAGVDSSTKFRDVYYRYYIKSASNWINPSNPNNSKLSRAMVVVDSAWSQAMIGHLWSQQSANQFLLSDPASCVTGSTVNCVGYNDFAHLNFLGASQGSTAIFAAPNLGSYVCVEHHVKLNDAGQSNGVSEFWVNDTLNASQTNLNYVGSYSAFALNGIFFENFINNGSPQNQVRDWDNIIVSTQRIGCTIFGGGATQPTHRLPFRIRP